MAGYFHELRSFVKATNFIIYLMEDSVPLHRTAVSAEGEGEM